jgi:hypothetical protein
VGHSSQAFLLPWLLCPRVWKRLELPLPFVTPWTGIQGLLQNRVLPIVNGIHSTLFSPTKLEFTKLVFQS